MVHAVHWIIGLLNIALALVTAGHALLFKRDPRAAWGWISICLIFPLGGPLLYLLFGINRVRTRAKRLTRRLPFLYYFTSPERPEVPVRVKPGLDLPVECRELAAISEAVSRRPLVMGNAVEAFYNGEEAFPAMLEAVEGAEESLYLATYILESNATGRSFIDALGRAKDRGVDVRVLLDGIGELYSFSRPGRLLKERGVPVAKFMPPTLIPPSFNINLRNHRKILAADGRVAFVGGMNIGDRHLVSAVENPRRVKDVQFRTAGPVVGQIEEVFLEDWAFATGAPEPPRAFHLPPPAGDAVCRTIVDGPNEDLDKLAVIMVGAASAAKRRIQIMTPYFLPSREMIGTLQAASLRGVEVDVVLPGLNNLPFVHRATRNMLWELLQWGIRAFYQPPPFVHTKLFIVDEHYLHVGSANLDPRSLRLNFELVVETFDPHLAARMAAFVDACRYRSRQISLQEVDGRPLGTRLLDSGAWLLSPYL
ncbi:MAG: phospholipase D-like domain-containing protein [Desulfobacteraceae bacterium]